MEESGKLSLAITLATLCMASFCGIPLTFSFIIGCRIIGWDLDMRQNITSNVLYMFPLKIKNWCFLTTFFQNHIFQLCLPFRRLHHISGWGSTHRKTLITVIARDCLRLTTWRSASINIMPSNRLPEVIPRKCKFRLSVCPFLCISMSCFSKQKSNANKERVHNA